MRCAKIELWESDIPSVIKSRRSSAVDSTSSLTPLSPSSSLLSLLSWLLSSLGGGGFAGNGDISLFIKPSNTFASPVSGKKLQYSFKTPESQLTSETLSCHSIE